MQILYNNLKLNGIKNIFLTNKVNVFGQKISPCIVLYRLIGNTGINISVHGPYIIREVITDTTCQGHIIIQQRNNKFAI